MAQVFLSYDRDDIERIEPLVRALEARGLSVFWDRDIAAGADWRKVIGHELSSAGCVVVAWSERSVESSWVLEEAEEAKAGGLLVPVCIDRVRPPIGFRAVQAADLCAWKGQPSHHSLQQLVATITERLERSLPRLPIGPLLREPDRIITAPPVETSQATPEAVRDAAVRSRPPSRPATRRSPIKALGGALTAIFVVALAVALGRLLHHTPAVTHADRSRVGAGEPSASAAIASPVPKPAESAEVQRKPTRPSIDGVSLTVGDAVYRRVGERLEFARAPIDTVSEDELVVSGKVVSHDDVSPAALSTAHEWKVGEVVLLSARKAPVVFSGLVKSVEEHRLVIEAWNPLRKAPELLRFELAALGKHAQLTEPVPARDAWQETLKAQLLTRLRSAALPASPASAQRLGPGPDKLSCTGSCSAALGSCCQGISARDCLARNQVCKRAYFNCRAHCSSGETP